MHAHSQNVLTRVTYAGEKNILTFAFKKWYEGLSVGKIALESVWVVISICVNLKTLPFPSTK